MSAATWRQRRQAGDTLVEVVISLAILAVTLTSAFNIANHSYSEGMQAREQTEAIYLAQDQAEVLYLYRDNLIAATPNAATPIMTLGNFGICDTGCHITGGAASLSPGAVTTNLGNGVTYYIKITPLSGPTVINAAQPGEAEFTVTVTWESAVDTGIVANGGTNENITSLNLILVDNRGIIPRDCSVVGGSACS